MARFRITALALALVLVPTTVSAYLTPEQVLEGLADLPTKRDTDATIARQQQRSRETREREQELLFSLQHPEWEEQEELIENELSEGETVKTAAPELQLSERDLELLKALRLIDQREQRVLDRIRVNQQLVRLIAPGSSDPLHSGAPRPLAPTGAGAALAVITMIAAAGWTMWQVRRMERKTRVLAKG